MNEQDISFDARSDDRAAFLQPTRAAEMQVPGWDLGSMLHRAARKFGGKPAILCGDVAWSYEQFDDMVTRLAVGLLSAGLQPGDRVALMARNSHWFAALRFAVARAGMVLVPVNFMLNAEDVAYILDHCRPELLICDATTAPVAKAAADATGLRRRYQIPAQVPGQGVAPESESEPSIEQLLGEGPAREGVLPVVESRQVAQIIYTSGTESRPKGAMLTHEAVLCQVQSCVIENGWTAAAVQLNAMPLFHCAQLDAFLAPALLVGATNIIIASPAADAVLSLIGRHRVTHFFAPPTIWISLLRSELFDRHDLSSLTHGYYGASIMPLEVLREMQRRLPRLGLYNLYGQTEITCVATVLKPEDQVRKAGSAGKAVCHVETRIVDDDMRDVGPGEIGEIVHRSPQLLTGYWRDPAKTVEAFAGGWFHSGDLGTMDEEGYITIVDRKKDMVKTGGENVSSREVEDVVYGLEGVAEAAVVGVPHPTWVEAVAALVVRKAGSAIESADVIGHCSQHLSRFKIPKQVIFLEALPRNASGKILKRELREIAAAYLQKLDAS